MQELNQVSMQRHTQIKTHRRHVKELEDLVLKYQDEVQKTRKEKDYQQE